MAKVYRNPDVMWREEDEAKTQALEDLERGEDIEGVGTSLLFADGVMVTLNMLGTEIWKLCDGRDLVEMLSALMQQFDVEEDVLKEDVTNFLAELAEKGFIYYEE